jgi:hypothetical protein
MRCTRWRALLAAPFLLACETPAAPLLVEGAERFEPPPAYRLWWDLTQECAGRVALFSQLRWYYVPDATTIIVDGRHVEGYLTAGNTIVLAEAAIYNGALVRHEMLHALHDVPGHPRDLFLGRCAGVVVCRGRCLEDAGHPPPANPASPLVGPSELEVGLELRPRPPSRGLYGGYFTLVVTARNPRSDSVIVELAPGPFGEPSVSFEWRMEDAVSARVGRARALDEGVRRFAPGETKRHVFDFNLFDPTSGQGGIGPGTYRISGAYGGHSSAAQTVVIP